MWSTVLKYGTLTLAFMFLAFFIMNKNMEQRALEKQEKKLIKKIYEAEENRRYSLYELENLKKSRNYLNGSKKIIVLNPKKNILKNKN